MDVTGGVVINLFGLDGRRRKRPRAAAIYIRKLVDQGGKLEGELWSTITLKLKPTNGDSMLVLTDSQQVELAVTFLDKKGKPVTPSTSVVWTSSDANVMVVTQSTTNPSQAMAVSQSPGTCQINASTTNPDGTVAAAVLDVQVMPGEAVSANVTAGTPTEQP